MLFRTLFVVLTLLAVTALSPARAAGDIIGSPEDAVAMVDRAIAFYKEVGQEAALAEFGNKQGKFIDRDLYIYVANPDGTIRSHAYNHGLVNKNLWDLKDVNGVFITREFVESGKNNPDGGWISYTWTNPTTKKLDPKKTFVKRHDNLLFMVGIYDQSRK